MAAVSYTHLYYPAGFLGQSSTSNAGDSQTKITRIFISHSSKDEKYVLTLANLLFAIGLKPEDIICSSVSGCSIPLNEDIYEFLRQQFQKQSLHVLFILSDNYYNSPASLNEMGAAWVVQACYTSILLPGFTSVSYTHLDVYKRQVYNFQIFIEFTGPSCPILIARQWKDNCHTP